jgi:sodium-dependent dicarboxylate transporter 2/3/5
MGMALVCFVVPAGRDPGVRLLEWRATQRIPWAVVFLFGGAMALAAGVEATGLDAYAGRLLGAGMTALPAGPLQILAIVITALAATQLTPSNLSTSAMLAAAITASTAGTDVILFAATIAASTDFLFPWTTPPNAIVYAAGRLNVRHMLRAGLSLTLISAALNTILVWLFM